MLYGVTTRIHNRFLSSGIRRKLWRIGRVLILLCLVLLAVVLYLVGTTSGRHAVLGIALPRLQERLPGHLTWTDIRWPSLDQFELEGILWRTTTRDTLLALAEAELTVSLWDLRRRDVYLPEVKLVGLQADLVDLQALMAQEAPGESPTTAAASPSSSPSFPRQGFVPGLPSVGVGAFQLDSASIRLTATQLLTLDHLQISIDLRPVPRDSSSSADATGSAAPDVEPLVTTVRAPAAVELENLLWKTLVGDTLAALVETELAVDLTQLVQHDLHLPRLRLAGLTVDLPAVQSQLKALVADQAERDDTAPVTGSTTATSTPLLRPGSVAGLPSASLGDLLLQSTTVHLTGDHRLEVIELKLTADLRADKTAEATVAWRLWPTAELACHARLQATLADSLRVQLTPLYLTVPATRSIPDPANLPLTGGIVAAISDLMPENESFALRISELNLTGDFGDLWLDGQLYPQGDGTLRLRARRPENRAHLLRVLGRLVGERTQALTLADSLWSFWPSHADPDVDLRLTLKPGTGPGRIPPGRVDLSGHFVLPGPRDLQILLPADLEVDDLDFVRGQVAGSIEFTGAEPTYRGTIDLSETSWLTRARVVADATGGQVTLDTLDLALPGLELQARGALKGEEIDLTAHLDVPDRVLLDRWPNEALSDLDAHLALDLAATGPMSHPDLDLDLRGGGSYGTTWVPAVTADVRSRAGDWQVDVILPEGLSLGSQQLTKVQFSYSGTLPDTTFQFGGRYRLAARDAERSLLTTGRVELNDTYFLQVDSLISTWFDQSLAARRPFQVSIDPQGPRARLTDLDLVGEPGRIRGAGTVQPDSMDVQLNVDLELVLASVQNWLPELPLSLAPEDTLVLAGDLRLQGSGETPAAHLDLQAGIHGHDQLGSLALDTRLWLLPPADTGSLTVTSSGDRLRSAQLPASAPGEGLAALLRVTHQDSLLIEGEASIPGQISLAPLAINLLEIQPGQLIIKSRTIQLSELAPYLPPSLDLSGTCEFAAEARGTRDDLQLRGALKAPGIRLREESGSWLTADGQVLLGGTVQVPQVEGKILVTAGMIQLPEIPPNLLPTEGNALLWQVAAADSASDASPTLDTVPDSLPPGTAGAVARPARTHTPITPELAVALEIPGNLRLRGHGLSAELAGNLTVGMQGNLPVAVGVLETTSGSLQFMGRIFIIERGKITFYGDEVSLNPELDIRLTTNVEGYVIWIQLLGSAEKPELVLSSDPFLSDGDIMSTLLFGKPLHDLDGGQQNLVTSRAGEVLAMYGSVKLQDSLSRQLGIDVISYSQGNGTDSRASLTVGKYLSPKVLMRYEKVLDQSNSYYVHLSYSLNRNFKLESTYSEGGNSGLTLGWNKEY